MLNSLPLLYPQKRKELICGLIYLPLHIFLMPFAVSLVFAPLLFGKTPSEATLTLIYYLIGFLFILVFMSGFLKGSFSDFTDRFASSLQSALLGYILYIIMLYAVSYILTLISAQPPSNPNNEAVTSQISRNWETMLVSTILLAPIVEETLFRGVLFGLIRKRSRTAAYIVSFLLFATYHLWTYALKGFDIRYIFYMLQYLPGSIALARCYEKSGTIWAPVLLHMMINGVSVFR